VIRSASAIRWVRPEPTLRVLAICCLVFLLPGRAAAEWHFTPMAGATFFGSTNVADPEQGTDNLHQHVGGVVSLLGGGLLGVETVFVWTPRFFNDDQAANQLVDSSRAIAWMGNIVLTAPRRWTEYNLRPFVSGGVGVLHSSLTEQPPGVLPGGELLPEIPNLLAFNVGGGAVGFFTSRTGIRFDVRYYSNLKPTEEGPAFFGNVRMRYMTASVGLVLRR
jgi:hypothetical protein